MSLKQWVTPPKPPKRQPYAYTMAGKAAMLAHGLRRKEQIGIEGYREMGRRGGNALYARDGGAIARRNLLHAGAGRGGPFGTHRGNRVNAGQATKRLLALGREIERREAEATAGE